MISMQYISVPQLLYRGVLLFLLALLVQSCKENTVNPEAFGTISGTVYDGETNEAVAGASITTSPPTSAIVTDGNGNFLIEDVPVGDYSVSATKNGYKKNAVAVSVKEGKTTDASIFIVEETTETTPPTKPSSPIPNDKAWDQFTSLTLTWAKSTAVTNNTITYDVYLYESINNSELVAENITDTMVTIERLNYGTSYFWQVIAKDSGVATTNGDVWTFRTRNFPSYPFTFAVIRDGNYEIFVADSIMDGETIQVTYSGSRDWWPRFNQRGDKIAFISDRDVKTHIYTMNQDGTDVYRVTGQYPVEGFHNSGRGFAWSPDGGQLLYSNYNTLYRIGIFGTGLTPVATAPQDRHFREVDWSPDWSRIVALTIGKDIYTSEIYLMDRFGQNMTVLVDDLPGILENPSFSIDGNKVMFTRDISGNEAPDGRQLDARIFLINTDGTGVTDLSTGKVAGTNDTNPRFTADGARIIFNNAPNDRPDLQEVWIMNADGTSRIRLYNEGVGPATR